MQWITGNYIRNLKNEVLFAALVCMHITLMYQFVCKT